MEDAAGASVAFTSCSHELLNSGGWWELFVLKAAIRMGGSIRALHARNAQHLQTTAELPQFLSGEYSLCFGAACHELDFSRFAFCSPVKRCRELLYIYIPSVTIL